MKHPPTKGKRELMRQKERISELVKERNPFVMHFYTEPKKPGTVVLSDWSGSMGGEKEEALKKAIGQVMPSFPNSKVFGFHDEVFEIDVATITKYKCEGNTSMGKALSLAWELNKNQILLITDGEPTDYAKESILNSARKHKGTPIYIIGIGDPIRGELDEGFLKKLALITGGQYKRFSKRELQELPNETRKLLEMGEGRLTR